MKEQCYNILLLSIIPFNVFSGVMEDGKIFLSNEDSAALYCAMNLFPGRDDISKYKINVLEKKRKLSVMIYESLDSDDSDLMGGGGLSFLYEYDKEDKTCKFIRKNRMR